MTELVRRCGRTGYDHEVKTTHNGISFRLVCLCERDEERLLRERAAAVRILRSKTSDDRTRRSAEWWIGKIDEEISRRKVA